VVAGRSAMSGACLAQTWVASFRAVLIRSFASGELGAAVLPGGVKPRRDSFARAQRGSRTHGNDFDRNWLELRVLCSSRAKGCQMQRTQVQRYLVLLFFGELLSIEDRS
jgi:hypothetical protein